MELYHLKTFVTVAEEGHLTRAAERLFTSQPAISAHIKALEEELGVVLFERTPRGMQLTPAGDLLLARAQHTLNAASEFMQHARGMQDQLLGTVRIGLNTDANFLRLIELQAALRERHPRLDIEFLTGSTSVNVPALRIGKLDAAFVSGECDEPLLVSTVLCEEVLAVAVPESLRARLGNADIPALARLPWVYTTEDCSHYGVMRALFEAHGCTPVKTVLANQEDALAAMVKAGVGLGIMRRDQVDLAEREGLAFALPLELPSVSLRFAYARKRANDPLLRAVQGAIAATWGLGIEAQREAG